MPNFADKLLRLQPNETSSFGDNDGRASGTHRIVADSESPRAAQPAELQEELCRQAGAISAVDVRFYEQHRELVGERLVPAAVKLLNEAIALVKQLQDISETSRAGLPLFGEIDEALDDAMHAIDGSASTAEERETARRVLGDTTFIIQMILRPKRANLAAITLDETAHADETWYAIDRASSALRNTLKSLRALERLLCKATGLAPRLQYSSQLQVSLAIRRRYADLWRHALSTKPSSDDLLPLFRSYGTGLAILVGNDIYPELRVNDRRQIRGLQDKILGWLRSPAKDHQEGLRIWQDVAGFSMLIRQVSRREELVKHDTELMAELSEFLRDSSTPMDGELFSKFRLIYGCNDDLDTVIRGRSRDLHKWRRALGFSPGREE